MELVSLPAISVALLCATTTVPSAQNETQSAFFDDQDVARLLSVLNSTTGMNQAHLRNIELLIDRHGKARKIIIVTNKLQPPGSLEESLKKASFSPANGRYKQKKIRVTFKDQ